MENKTSRYLKYAIGEIILVVIGILIALQINNWNEGRKSKIQSKTYKNTIVNDLAMDTLNINALIEKSKKYKKNINNYFSYIDSIHPSKDNIDKLFDSIAKVKFIYMKYYPVNNSYKQMATSGNGNLLNKEQRDFLLDLLATQEELNIIIDSQLEIAVNNSDKSDLNGGFPYNIYEKLDTTNSEERQIQALIHTNIVLHAVEGLYAYIQSRGDKIKQMIQDNIHLFLTEE